MRVCCCVQIIFNIALPIKKNCLAIVLDSPLDDVDDDEEGSRKTDEEPKKQHEKREKKVLLRLCNSFIAM